MCLRFSEKFKLEFSMSQPPNEFSFKPKEWHTVTPRIVVHGVEEFVQFLKNIFEATGDYRSDVPAIMTVGDSRLMISEVGIRPPSPAFLYVYVADADGT